MTLLDAIKWVLDKLDEGFWFIFAALLGALWKVWRKFSTDSARIDLLEKEMEARAALREDDREAVREVKSHVERLDTKIDDLRDILLRKQG